MKRTKTFGKATSQLMAFIICASAAFGQAPWKQEYDAGVQELKAKKTNINIVLAHFQKAVKEGRAAGIKEDDWKRCLWNLGTTQRAAGKYGDAEKTLTELIAYEKKEGKETEFTADAIAEQALVKHLEKDYTGADKLYGKAIPVVRRIRKESSDTKADQIWGWSDTKFKLGEYSLAVALKEEALKIRRKMDKGDKMMEAVILSDLAETAIKAGKNKEAVNWGKQAVSIFEKSGTRFATGLADAAYYVAVADSNLGNHNEAESYAKTAIAIHEKLFGKKSKEVEQDQNILNKSTGKTSHK